MTAVELGSAYFSEYNPNLRTLFKYDGSFKFFLDVFCFN